MSHSLTHSLTHYLELPPPPNLPSLCCAVFVTHIFRNSVAHREVCSCTHCWTRRLPGGCLPLPPHCPCRRWHRTFSIKPQAPPNAWLNAELHAVGYVSPLSVAGYDSLRRPTNRRARRGRAATPAATASQPKLRFCFPRRGLHIAATTTRLVCGNLANVTSPNGPCGGGEGGVVDGLCCRTAVPTCRVLSFLREWRCPFILSVGAVVWACAGWCGYWL